MSRDIHKMWGFNFIQINIFINSEQSSTGYAWQRDKVKDVSRDYGIQLPYHKAWHGKEVACKDLHGNEFLSFDNLRWYVDAVMATNSENYVGLECTPDDHRFR
ncbi:hypothetical protein QJS10_CPB19g00361 [Acorus calamus]|uniref:Uncharacterized protein n=1 Tax=Acorus calamus TaxID=4465 RepID=A0AAV9CIP7_ACOCL|nr:hypothetical protein QJS10_CPB19g00361 [Acorus calamus]